MPKPILKTRLAAGVRSTPVDGGSASQFCRDAANFFSGSDGLSRRAGNHAFLNVMRPDPLTYDTLSNVVFGWGDELTTAAMLAHATDEPSEPNPSFTGGPKYLFVGATSPFCRVHIDGYASNVTDERNSVVAVHYWNDDDAAFAQVNGFADGRTEIVEMVPGVNTYIETTNGPWTNSRGTSGTAGLLGTQVSLAFDMMPRWGEWDVGFGGPLWWIAIEFSGTAFGGTVTGIEVDHVNDPADPYSLDTGIAVQHGRVLCVSTFLDRDKNPHTFFARNVWNNTALRGEVRYWLDGRWLTEVGELPRNTAPDHKVSVEYHAGTNRLIGQVEGLGWFYCVLDPPDGNIYLLDAFYDTTSSAAALNPYAPLAQGLRTVIPTGPWCIHDGRLFVGVDDQLAWSGAAIYPDTWPNEFERFLSDGRGPIVDLVSLGGTLLVVKRSMVYLVQATGAVDAYDGVPLISGVGAIGALTPCGGFALMACEDGLRLCSGSSVVKISGQLDRAFFERTLGPGFARSIGVFFPPMAQWRLFYPRFGDNVCDNALYVDLDGWTPDSEGEEKSMMGVWPQGAHDDQPYAFRMTAAHLDETAAAKRVIYGCRWGAIFEMDLGYDEYGQTRSGFVEMNQQNVASSQGFRVNAVNVIQRTIQSKDLSVIPIPNGREKSGTSTVNWARRAGALAGIIETADKFEDGVLLVAVDDPIASTAAAGVVCQSFGFRLEDTGTGDTEIIAFEVEGNASGRRY